jgi:hypothetical protein
VPWSGAPDCPVHQGTSRWTPHLREKPEALCYNSLDCPVYTRQCPMLQGRAPQELASFGNLLRYNSPDMSGVHRTVRWASGATTTSHQRSPATALNACESTQKSGTREVAHRTLYSACPVCHRTSRRSQQSELQRSEPNGLVTWLAHRTLSGAPCDRQPHQTASLVVGAINTPNHPTFKSSKFSHFQPLTKARHSIQDTPKWSNLLPIPQKL